MYLRRYDNGRVTSRVAHPIHINQGARPERKKGPRRNQDGNAAGIITGKEGASARIYPDCDFVAWGKPIPEKCPECGSAYMIEKFLKAGPVAQCPNPECKFKKPLPAPVETAEVEVKV